MTSQDCQTFQKERVETFPEVVDNTIISTFTDCPLKAYRNYCLNLEGAESIHLHAGKCFAKALEVVRDYVWNKGFPYDDAILVAFADFMKNWGEFEVPANSAKTFERVWGAVDHYFKEWPIETDPITPFEKGTEFTFAIPLEISHPKTGAPIIFGGRADMIGEYNGMLCIVDEKTTSALGASWVEQWRMSSQFMGYCWAANKMGIGVRGAIIRGISILKTKYGTAEVGPLLYPKHMLERWERNLYSKLSRFINHYRESGEPEERFPMSFGTACNNYGGCTYRDLCYAERPSDWYGNFGTRNWNPLTNEARK